MPHQDVLVKSRARVMRRNQRKSLRRETLYSSEAMRIIRHVDLNMEQRKTDLSKIKDDFLLKEGEFQDNSLDVTFPGMGLFYKARIISDDFLQEIISASKNKSNPELQLRAIQSARILLCASKQTIPISVIEKVIMPVICNIMKEESNMLLQLEAVFTIKYASNSSQKTKDVIATHALPHFVNLLEKPLLAEQIIWVLNNVISKESVLREYFVRSGILLPGFHLIYPGKSCFLASITGAILQLISSMELDLPKRLIQCVFQASKLFIQHNDKIILTDTVWTISKLTSSGRDNVQVAIQHKILPLLIPLINHNDTNIRLGAISTIGNIVSIDEKSAKYVLDQSKALDCIKPLIKDTNESIQKEAIWTISNMMSYNEELIEIVFAKEGILSDIIGVFACGQGYGNEKCQEEALWAMCNVAAAGNKNQLMKLIDANALTPLCSFFHSPNQQIITVVLDSIDLILTKLIESVPQISTTFKKCIGINEISTLHKFENSEINSMVNEIIRKHFS